ncbi:TetR/AcrR family transcriptional regulator [Nocardia iowensis]|uniref:TetR/AcrR family transcriptional regulator n=1 Tax=Nocardia iowensis TaxID=204891 RepID=A0ABX8RSW8_NOCIO|nr:TetR/AcrR family transcriptional regulator [Nocardia iowensis]QXN91969.1 TetR/AcrR family transcriptional regulator [Nocardia iowensis]
MIGAGRSRSARGAGAQLRTEILDAARELLARTGHADAVSIRDISKRVGVSAPSIYRHFADKDALIDAVVAQVFEDLDAAMRAATDPTASPTTRLQQQGLAYVRFAREHPEQYRLATTPTIVGGAVDQVLSSGAFQHFSQTVQECMDAGVMTPGDPLPIVLDLWAAAHGIASLLIAKPYIPWGDTDAAANRVLRAACIGHVVVDMIGSDPAPDEAADWLSELRHRL